MKSLKSRKISPLVFVLITLALAGGAAFAFANSIKITDPNQALNVGQVGMATDGYKIGGVTWTYDKNSPADDQLLTNVTFTMTTINNVAVTGANTTVELALTSAGTSAVTCRVGTSPVAGTVTCQPNSDLPMNQVTTFNLVAYQNNSNVAP